MTRPSSARTRPLARGITLGVTGLGLVGALAGCTTGTSTGGTSATSGSGLSSSPSSSAGSTSSGSTSTGGYKDGTYTEDGSYSSPGGQETITVKVTLANSVITAVTVTPHATGGQPKQYQDDFAGGISDVVVGKKIDSLSVSRVAGSSLTSNGFNKAIAAIKADAS